MRTPHRILVACVLLCLLSIHPVKAQDEQQDAPGRTMRPIIRGLHYAVASMKAEATRAAERILESGGNAFDAIVAGQAVLGVVDAAMNGIGSDAVILIYDARAKKVVSLNAEGTAPRLATIEWYKKNNGGKLPQSDGLLSGTVPGMVDAWYILLDRWGTMSFEKVLEHAIDLSENGFPIGNSMARAIQTSRKITKYPTTSKIYLTDGKAPNAGDIFRNPALARTLKKLVEAEKQSASRAVTPRYRQRGIVFTKAISRSRWLSSPKRTVACSDTKTLRLTRPKSRSLSPPSIAATRSSRIPLPARGRRNCLR